MSDLPWCAIRNRARCWPHSHSLALQPKNFHQSKRCEHLTFRTTHRRAKKHRKKDRYFLRKASSQKSCARKGVCVGGGMRSHSRGTPEKTRVVGRAYAANYGNYLGEHFFPDAPGPKTPAENCPHHLGKLPQNAKKRQTLLPRIRSRQAMRTSFRRHLRVPLIDALLLLPDAA